MSVGFGFGGCGTALAQKAFTGCDLLIAVGCKFGEVATGSYGFKLPKKTIHIDANPRVIGANFLPTVGMIADAGQALSSILSEIGSYERKDECSFVDGLTREKSLYFEAIQDLPDNADYVNPRKLLVRLRVQLDRNAILTTDSGNHSFYVLSDFQALLPRTVIAPTDYNAMGFSVPAAVSASLQFPDRQVVSIVGDGGFLMTGVELLTARKMGARPITIVFHDGALGLIKVMQQNLMRRPSAVDLPSMDLKGFAKWLDLEYVLIENDLEIDSGLRRALRAKRPVVVDAKVRYQEPTRYFKAVALANARRMPFSQVTRIGGRLLRRLVLPSKKL